MKERIDARIQKTKEKLRSALLDILLEKELSTVSVSEICQKAGVNRNTFYAHYKSVSALLNSIEEDFLNEIIEKLKESTEPYNGDLITLLDVLMSTVRENGDMCRLMFSDYGDQGYLDKIVDYALPVALPSWTGNMSREDAELLYRFIAGGSVSVIRNWVRSAFQEPQERIVWKLKLFVEGIVSGFVSNAH